MHATFFSTCAVFLAISCSPVSTAFCQAADLITQTSIVTMSSTDLGNPSYFESSTRDIQTRGSRSSEAVSPTASVRSRKLYSRQSHETRPPISPRSKSEQHTRTMVNVQTIEEGVVHDTFSSTLGTSGQKYDGRFSSASRTEYSGSSAKSYESSNSSQRRNHPPFQRSLPPSLERGESDSAVLKAKPKISWSRSHSGGFWYDKQRIPIPHDDSSSGRSYVSRTASENRTITPIVPLRPPQRSQPHTFQSSVDHKVKMETSFTSLQDEAKRAMTRLNSTSETSRRSSINPLRIFSAPFNGLRRFNRAKHGTGKEASHRRPQPTISLSEAQDHRSLLKRQETGAVLERVSMLLDGSKHPTVKPFGSGTRTMSERSESSHNSNTHNAHRSHLPYLPALSKLSTNKSYVNLADSGSYSSSLVKLRMGPTPKNTPDERATYKIKRSPSTDTEEFLKIDISVRGETSYLPSEARRIHTPPLPEYGPNGMRRGFFFDYNAPKHDGAKKIARPDTNARRRRSGHTAGEESTTNIRPSRRLVSDVTIGKIHVLQKGLRLKTADWYDAQLAELDDEGAEATQERSKHGDVMQLKNMEYESMLDYSIPEHLPNSPLCPRNPRYWRIVQGRGSQFRGCWMHGFGEYE